MPPRSRQAPETPEGRRERPEQAAIVTRADPAEVEVRVLASIAGLDFSWTPGQTVRMPAEEAAKWADGERCEYVDPRRETTNAAPRVEMTAANRRSSKR